MNILVLRRWTSLRSICEGGPGTGEIEEGPIGGEEMFVPEEYSAELSQSCLGALDIPAASGAPQPADFFLSTTSAGLEAGSDEVEALLLEALSQRVGVGGSVGDEAWRSGWQTSSGHRGVDLGENDCLRLHCCRRGDFLQKLQRKTASVALRHLVDDPVAGSLSTRRLTKDLQLEAECIHEGRSRDLGVRSFKSLPAVM